MINNKSKYSNVNNLFFRRNISSYLSEVHYASRWWIGSQLFLQILSSLILPLGVMDVILNICNYVNGDSLTNYLIEVHTQRFQKFSHNNSRIMFFLQHQRVLSLSLSLFLLLACLSTHAHIDNTELLVLEIYPPRPLSYSASNWAHRETSDISKVSKKRKKFFLADLIQTIIKHIWDFWEFAPPSDRRIGLHVQPICIYMCQ